MRYFMKLDEHAIVPTRATEQSAGHDFHALETVTFAPFETKIVPTGIAAYMQPDDVLMLYIRSSVAYKRGFLLANGAGVIDADYAGRPIGAILYNNTDTNQTIHAGERICQGVFMKYLVTDDDTASGTREGGFGSTGN